MNEASAAALPALRTRLRLPWQTTRGANLKLQLCLLISLLLALVTAAGGAYVVRRAHADILVELDSTVTLMQRLIAAELAGAHSEDGRSPLRLASLQHVRHVEVSYYARDGRLIDRLGGDGVSERSAPALFDWLVSRSFTPPPAYREAVWLDGQPAGEWVLRPDPGYEIDEIWTDCRGLLTLLLVFFVLVNALVWWAVARALRPVERILVALRDVEEGRLDTRLPDLQLPELARLSRGFNDMAQRLEDSLAANRRMTRRLLQMQEAERTRLARELHDELGQCITAIHAEAVTIRRRCEDTASTDAAILAGTAAIIEVASETGQLMRSMLRRLRPAALDRLGLGAGLRELVNGFAQRAPNLRCSLRVDATLAELHGERPVAVYRIVQESLTNAVRHAAAASVDIEICRTRRGTLGEGIEVSVRDDGRGGAREATQGFGLLGMRERAAALGGRYSLDSPVGGGTRILVWLPLDEPAASEA